MTSWFSSQSVRYGRIIPAALVVATIGLFAATGLLYRAQSERQELLASTVRTSGWVAYQAQLEYVKADAAIEIALAAPTAKALNDLQLRLEILVSRLGILYQSEEGQLLRDQQEFRPTMEGFEATITGWLDRLPSLAPGAPSTTEVIAGWREELKPLGRELQSILLTSVAYNSEVYRREQQLAANPATIPLALMFLSGGGLIGLLFIQNARDRSRLADVMAAQAREAATRANFRAAIEAMPAVIVIFDPHSSKVSFINPAGAALIDPSPDHPEWARLIQAALAASEAGSYSDLNIGVPRADGSIMSLRGSSRDVIWEGRLQVLLALADTSQVRDAELQVMQSAKLATLGEMASAIAHELNQPLAVIKMASTNVRRLMESGAPIEAMFAKLDRIEGQIDRAKRITDQVRRYARAPSPLSGSVPLRQAIELAAGFVSEQFRTSGIRLELAIELSPEVNVNGEQTMLEQTFVNLLVNARDAFEAGGKAVRDRRVAITAETIGVEAVISVTDNAGGIAPEVIDRLFDPFTTTKSAEKGTGLGLSLARTVIRNMEGTITAANVEGGACFTIRLPVAMTQPSKLEVA